MGPAVERRVTRWVAAAALVAATLFQGELRAAEATVDTRGTLVELAQGLQHPTPPALGPLLDDLGREGFWLLPPGCEATAPHGTLSEIAREAIFDQDAATLRAAVMDSMKRLVCSSDPIAVSAWAEHWFWLGAAALMVGEGAQASLFFAAIHRSAGSEFTPPDLGKRVREAFEEAAGITPEPAGTLSAARSAGRWYLDGQLLPDADVRLFPLPHLIQIATPADRRWTAILLPQEGGGWISLGSEATSSADVATDLLVGLARADVARWLRVYAGQVKSGATVAGGQAIEKALKVSPEIDVLVVAWSRPDGVVETWKVVEPPPPARVWWSATTGLLLVQGALFQPLNVKADWRTPTWWRVETGLGVGLDYGTQGPAMRVVLQGHVGGRHPLRVVPGLSGTLGAWAMALGPDPLGDDRILVQVMPGGEVAYSPVWLPWLRVDMGAAVAPGLWRSDGLESVSPQVPAVWLGLGGEWR